eukprot:1128622-Prorocentrum_minimum.AAC.1
MPGADYVVTVRFSQVPPRIVSQNDCDPDSNTRAASRFLAGHQGAKKGGGCIAGPWGFEPGRVACLRCFAYRAPRRASLNGEVTFGGSDRGDGQTTNRTTPFVTLWKLAGQSLLVPVAAEQVRLPRRRARPGIIPPPCGSIPVL